MFSLFWKCQCWLFPQMFGGNCCWLVQANVHFLIWLIKIKESIWKPFKEPSSFGVFFVPVVYGKLSPTWGIQSELRNHKNRKKSSENLSSRKKATHSSTSTSLKESLNTSSTTLATQPVMTAQVLEVAARTVLLWDMFCSAFSTQEKEMPFI